MRIEHCLWCHKSLQENQPIFRYLFQKDSLCLGCRIQFKDTKQNGKIETLTIFSFYEYDDYFQSVIFQHKECKDEALKEIYLEPYLGFIKRKYRGSLFVMAPSSSQKTTERGFEPVRQIFEVCNIPIESWFIKIDDTKQSILSKEQRSHIKDKIILDGKHYTKKRIVLIDDVCTTGSTLLAMHNQLTQIGIQSEALVLAVHPLLHKKLSKK